jgi:hypothetical protein
MEGVVPTRRQAALPTGAAAYQMVTLVGFVRRRRAKDW